MVQSVRAMNTSAQALCSRRYSALSAPRLRVPGSTGLLCDASAVLSPRPVMPDLPALPAQRRTTAGSSEEALAKPVPSQGAPETRSGPARREHEPHFLWAGRGEAESISCCAAEAGGDVTAFTLPRLAATRGPEFSSSPGEWPGAPRRWKDPRLRAGRRGGRPEDPLFRLPGPAWPGPAAPPPASSPG
ncbi:unnamed protein product [Rangifer tarandus platyrhynchus]|uniref:Uncharacterized protein n=1 Tax=Rangifer tarandus platyrhynchus TaxID=3082113 RepID=A0ACB1MJ27_RANTA